MRGRRVPKRRIYVVDDKPKVCAAVRSTLERTRCEVRTFTSAADCLKRLRRSPCRLLITDVRMPAGMGGMELLTEVKRMVPMLPVIVITGYGDVPQAVEAIKAGAEDYILKPFSSEALLSPVRAVLKRMAPIPSQWLRPLTSRQLDVLPLLQAGMTNKEIAEVLYINHRTVEDHVSGILRRHGAKNRKELIAIRAKLDRL